MDLINWVGLSATDDQLREIVSLCEPFFHECLDDEGYKREPRFGYGLDTMERDYFFDGVAKYVGGTHWPLNMESGSEYSKNFPKMLIAAIEGGKLEGIDETKNLRSILEKGD